jgi:hypothetical protein
MAERFSEHCTRPAITCRLAQTDIPSLMPARLDFQIARGPRRQDGAGWSVAQRIAPDDPPDDLDRLLPIQVMRT